MAPFFPKLRRQATTSSNISESTINSKPEHSERELAYEPKEDDIGEEEEKEDNVGHAAYIRSLAHEKITPAENKAILRRIDWFLLPLFLVTQTLQYLDKTALNYAKVFGLDKALHLSGGQFSWLASIFYVGYLVAQPPTAWLLGKYPAGRVLGISCIIWGALVLAMIGCKGYVTGMVVRFLLGVFEAGVTPGLSLMTGWFYTRDEAPLRQTIWYSAIGWGGMLGSLMAAGISRQPESTMLPRWQQIFVILGCITMLWGVVLYIFLADGPSNARWLKPESRVLAVARVADNGVGIKSRAFRRYQMWEAFTDIKAWCLTLAMFGSSIPNGILSNFSGTIIKAMGFSTFDAALLDCAGRSFQIISLMIAGFVATKFKNTRMLMMTAGNVVCVLATALLAFLPTSMTWGRLISFWLVNVQSVGFTLGLVMVSSNFGGYTKKSVTSSMVFVAYCAGNMAGPQFIYESEAPRYRTGAIAMMASYTLKLVAHCVLWGWMIYENRRRNKRHGPADVAAGASAGMEDKTEKENPNFRYVL
ncbi:hypothetical protein RQP46_002154 [Phenoliferia psychrophenolica]